MNADEARAALASFGEDGEPVVLPAAVLAELSINDMTEGVEIAIGTITKDHAIVLEWNGKIYRSGNALIGEADYTWTRKYWYSPLGLEQYLDLVRRAVETRNRLRGDVAMLDYDDDGAYIQLRFKINTAETDLASAYAAICKADNEIRETAERAADEVGKQIAEIAGRLSDWGAEPFDHLIGAVERARSSDDKGRALEELCSRLLSTVNGFTVTGRLRTETEEIDITVLNASGEARLRREGAIVLFECKNWSEKCGKNEFVVFKEKLANRSGRCTVGFLISWNGFAGTVTKEMLRGSREELLIVPMTGDDIRAAVQSGGFERILLDCWDRAVQT